MAIRFDAETDSLTCTTNLPTTTSFTMLCWFRMVTDRNDYSTIVHLQNASAGRMASLNLDADGTTLRAFDSLLAGPTGVNASAGTWYAAAAAVNGANCTLYWGTDPASLSTASSASFVPDATTAASTLLQLGDNPYGAFWLDGDLANVKIYGATLNASEVAADLSRYAPVRTANLLHYYPFVSDLVDYSGNGNTLTAGSTSTTFSAGPTALDALPALPTYVADRGTVANVTAATTSALTLTSPTSIAVGNYLIARVAVDNSAAAGAAPGCTVTDPRSNTWTVLGPALSDPGAAAAGATAYLCYTRVDTAYQAADALTFNWGAITTTAKAVVVEEWDNIHRITPVAVAAVTNNSVTAASTTAVTAAVTPTTPNQLVYTCLATEGIAADTVGADADTTNGTWITLTTTASADATATNNQRVSGQYKVVTAAGAQSWDSTITSRDWGAIAVVFAVDEPPPPRVFVRPGLAATQGGSW